MADNVPYQSTTLATPASGTNVATDEVQVGGTQPLAQVQFMKLVDGSLNGTDPIKGDSANGMDVDVTRLPTTGTATRTSVNDQATATTILAANTSRKMAIIVNDSTADLYVGLGSNPTTSDFSYFLPGKVGNQMSQLELPLPVYTGLIAGIWSADSTGAARVTELT